jgi:hypothetical protein
MNERSDSYLGNPNVKRDGVSTPFTQEQILEYKKCMDDPVYFAKKYCKVVSLDEGLIDFDLYPYQEKMFNQFNENRFNIVLACRQSGKSISSVAYLLWFGIFHSEKTIVILANKGATAKEMLARITIMLENLPFFIQPGCKALNKHTIEFSNNSRIVAAATSASSIRGMSASLLYLDEFAFVENASEFYTSTYPVITSGKSTKVIITSTANGVGNMFHKLWEGAVQGVNEYIPFRVDWWDVPGRDEKWKEQTINNTSEIQFDQEFGNTFFGTGDTLIESSALLEQKRMHYKHLLENNCLRIYEEPEIGHEYIMTVDVSKGVGGDYSTFNIIDVTSRPFRQVAVYRNNKISPVLFPNIIVKYAEKYNKCYVVVENNDQGAVVCNGIYFDLEYENFYMESSTKSTGLGVTMNKKVKRLGCSAIKDIVENRKINIVDDETIIEMSTFVSKGHSFEASQGNHDDLMMNLVLFGYFTNTQFFGDLIGVNMKSVLFDKEVNEIDENIVPFGFIDDGLDDALTAEEHLERTYDWSLNTVYETEEWGNF